MASWQFAVSLVPLAALADDQGLPVRVTRERLRSEDWWNRRVAPPDLLARADVVLERRETWSPEVLGWGVEDGDRLDVLLSGTQILEVQARIDAREVSVGFLERLLAFAEHVGAALVTEEGEIVVPDLEHLVREVRNSSAHRFVVDPTAYLENLRHRLP